MFHKCIDINDFPYIDKIRYIQKCTGLSLLDDIKERQQVILYYLPKLGKVSRVSLTTFYRIQFGIAVFIGFSGSYNIVVKNRYGKSYTDSIKSLTIAQPEEIISKITEALKDYKQHQIKLKKQEIEKIFEDDYD